MTNRKRGRPSTINEADVVDRALSTFWRFGFHATSMNELAREVGVSKPSLYATFGDKSALLRRALDVYSQKNSEQVEAISSIEAPAAFFRAYWQIFIEDLCDERLPAGCFLIQSTVECSGPNELCTFIEGLHTDSRAMIEARLRDDRANGRIGSHVDIPAMADFIGGQAFALGVMSSAGADRSRLEGFADQAAAALARLL